MALFALARCPVGRRLEMGVAVSPATAMRHDHLIAGVLQVAQQMTTVAIANQGPGRNLDDQIRAAAPEAIGTLAVLAALCLPMALMGKMREVRMPFGRADDHAAAMTPIAAVGASARCIFLPPKAHAAVAASPSSHKNRHPIDKHAGLIQ